MPCSEYNLKKLAYMQIKINGKLHIGILRHNLKKKKVNCSLFAMNVLFMRYNFVMTRDQDISCNSELRVMLSH